MIDRSVERSGSEGVSHNVNSVYAISIFLIFRVSAEPNSRYHRKT